ncbi:LytTR family transcriptional regulator DNA-binding domain-containing protein [candidate division KSB1 bacterium]
MSFSLSFLPPENFIRIHKSFAAAINKIGTIQNHFVIVNGIELPIGESFRKEFFSKIQYSGS